MNEEINFKYICDLTTEVMGLPIGSLAYKNRSRNIQTARSVAGYIGLIEENINRNIIALVLNRSRPATYHYERAHKKNFKHCIVYRNTFTKVYKKYKELDGEKSLFTSSKKIKKYLLKNKVYESRNSDIKLEVISGEAKCFIYTNYFDYLNQIKNINIAMENHECKINII